MENEIVSEQAFRIIEKYKGETSIEEFANNHGMDINKATNGFQEIQDRIFGCLLEGNSILYSQIEQIRANGQVKIG